MSCKTNIVLSRPDIQNSINNYYISYPNLLEFYSNSNILAYLVYITGHNLITLKTDNGIIRFHSLFQMQDETEIPLSSFNPISINLSASSDELLYKKILKFFGECEREITKEIRAVWMPMGILTPYGLNIGKVGAISGIFYLHCPKTGLPYQCQTLEDGSINIAVSYIILDIK